MAEKMRRPNNNKNRKFKKVSERKQKDKNFYKIERRHNLIVARERERERER